jgi:hypothetical protein
MSFCINDTEAQNPRDVIAKIVHKGTKNFPSKARELISRQTTSVSMIQKLNGHRTSV